jgi:hypothetical protein
VTVTVVAGGYRAVPESLTAITWRAKSAIALRFRTCGRLYSCDAILKRLAQGLEDMAAEFGELIPAAHAVVRPRHLPRRRHLAAADRAHIGDRLGRGAERVGRHQRWAVARQAGDAVDACGRMGFGQRHRRPDGGQPPRQPRLPPREAEEEEIWVTTPASHFASSELLGMAPNTTPNLLLKLNTAGRAIS